MTRTERYGLGAAVLGHVALFAFLSLAWSNAPTPPPMNKPIEVSLADDVALDQTAPKAPEPPAQSAAPDPGPPADAPPPEAEEVAPEPAPPKPAPPKPSPPKPAPPKPTPPKPPAKPDAVPPPKPVLKPKPKPAAKKPVAEKSDDAPDATPAPKKVTPKKATSKKTIPVEDGPAKAASAKSAAAKGKGSNPKATKAKPTGSLLDDDFRKGLTQSPSKTKASTAAPGATMDAKAAADIGSAIKRQVQPCADRQVNPGPGASRIVVTIRLSLNRDGSLAGRPTVADEHGGVDDENRRYVDTVDRNAIATFTGCAPLRGLPPELYDVPRGWKTFILRYKLPG